jgi:tetratricopeptide (TPR) repeat protein
MAAAGDYDRAEAIVFGFPDLERRLREIALLAEAAAARCAHDRAVALAAEAERLGDSVTHPTRREWARADVAGAVAAAGEYARAEAIARNIADLDWREMALAGVAGATAATGDYDKAEAIARSITSAYRQARALVELAQKLADAGEREQAAPLALAAEALAPTITDVPCQAEVLTGVALVMAAIGEQERAETIASSITEPNHQTPRCATASMCGASTVGSTAIGNSCYAPTAKRHSTPLAQCAQPAAWTPEATPRPISPPSS